MLLYFTQLDQQPDVRIQQVECENQMQQNVQSINAQTYE